MLRLPLPVWETTCGTEGGDRAWSADGGAHRCSVSALSVGVVGLWGCVCVCVCVCVGVPPPRCRRPAPRAPLPPSRPEPRTQNPDETQGSPLQ